MYILKEICLSPQFQIPLHYISIKTIPGPLLEGTVKITGPLKTTPDSPDVNLNVGNDFTLRFCNAMNNIDEQQLASEYKFECEL